MLIGLESVDDLLELLDHFRAHDVDRRVVDRDTPIGGRPLGHANLCRFLRCIYLCEPGRCARSCHGILLRFCWSTKAVDEGLQRASAIRCSFVAANANLDGDDLKNLELRSEIVARLRQTTPAT